MKVLVLLFIVAMPLVFAANLRSRVYYEYAFETYRRQYKKEYVSADEHMYRLQVFADNLDIIDKTNKEGHKYTLGVNKFADMTVQEFINARFCGCFGGVPNKLHTTNSTRHHLRISAIDWVEKGAVSPVKDQASCGSCWAFSATGSIESVNYLATKKMVLVSEQQLVDCSGKYGNQGCNGGWMDNAFDYVKANGICSEEDYPYVGVDNTCKTTCKPAVKISGYVDNEPTEDALETSVSQNPVSVAINASPLMLYTSGIFDGPCSASLNHGVLAVGFGEEDGTKYWRVKNSWGGSWGEKGYFRLIRGIGGTGECGIASVTSYPTL